MTVFASKIRQRDKKEARAIMKKAGIHSLLAEPSANPKVAKNATIDVLTAPMHLAPAKLSGYNVCPMATKGCAAACLHTAGNPLYMAGKSKARIRRTVAYFQHRNAFMVQLASEIDRHVNAAKRKGMLPAVRLNATSDIRFECVPVILGRSKYANLMELFPNVIFYDYTKIANRKRLPPNYSLTFSLAEDNDTAAVKALRNGMNVAAVFDTTKSAALPARYKLKGTRAHTVIDGDIHDYRPSDPSGVIVGLRAKGKARGDQSGFVRKATA